MLLPVPIPTVDPGPDWAQNLYACLYSQVDAHNHSSGQGVQINPNGININSDLTFNDNNAIGLLSARFLPQTAPLSGAFDLGCVYVSGVDLWYNDVSGNQVKLTSGGTVNATSSGIASGTATASFSGSVLVVDSASNTPANIQAGSYLMGNNVVNSNFLTLLPPNAMAAGYSLTFPSLPGTASIMQLNASGTDGNISASNNLPGTITVASGSSISSTTFTAGTSGSTLSPTTLTLGGTGAVLTSSGTTLVAGNGISPSGISNALISGLNANTLQITNASATSSYPIVVSAAPIGPGLQIVRGQVNSAGVATSGEGFSVSHAGTGVYTVTYNSAFTGSPPVVVASPVGTAQVFASPTVGSTSSFQVVTSNASGAINSNFSFISIGQRLN